jgi:hypothetical protein
MERTQERSTSDEMSEVARKTLKGTPSGPTEELLVEEITVLTSSREMSRGLTEIRFP